jgi:hypothetical protein
MKRVKCAPPQALRRPWLPDNRIDLGHEVLMCPSRARAMSQVPPTQCLVLHHAGLELYTGTTFCHDTSLTAPDASSADVQMFAISCSTRARTGSPGPLWCGPRQCSVHGALRWQTRRDAIACYFSHDDDGQVTQLLYPSYDALVCSSQSVDGLVAQCTLRPAYFPIPMRL